MGLFGFGKKKSRNEAKSAEELREEAEYERRLAIEATKAVRHEAEANPPATATPVPSVRVSEMVNVDPPDCTNRGRRIVHFKADDGTKFEVYQNAIASRGEIHWLNDVHATVEDGSAVQDRITATRIMLVGVFALAWKKKRGGEKWLTIAGPNFFWLAEVGRKQISDAMRFAAAVNNAALKTNHR